MKKLSKKTALFFVLVSQFLIGHQSLMAARETITLADAIVRTLELNPGVQVEKEKVNQSRALLTKTAGAFDWLVFGSAASSFEEDNDVSVNTSFGATKRFRSGIEITPSFSNFESSKISSQFIERSGAAVNLRIRIPLLRGLGSRNARAEELAANINWTASKYLSKHNVTARVTQTATRFWECLGASQIFEILDDSERRSREIVDLVQLLVDGGELNPVYLGEATGRFYKIKVDVGQGRLNLFRARQALAVSMGDGPANTASSPLAVGFFPPLIKPEDVNDALVEIYGRQALKKRGDYQASLKRIDAQDVLLHKARNDKKPRVDFTLDSGYAEVDETLFDSFLGPSHESLSGPVIQGKVNVELPLSNRFAQGEIRHRLSKKNESKLRSSELANVILAQIAEAIEMLRSSVKEINLARQSKEAYLASVKQERVKITNGAGSLTYLIRLDQNYTEARITHVRALQKYATALVRLRFVTRTIFKDSEDEVLFQMNNLMELPPIH